MAKYIVIKQYFDTNKMFKVGEEVELPKHKADIKLKKGLVVEPVKVEKKTRKRTTKKEQ